MTCVTNPLSDLIQQSLNVRGWTVADLHRETVRLDPARHGVAYSTLASWVNAQGKSTPRPNNLDLVARALGLDPEVVHRAARAAGGYRVEEADVGDPELQVFAADYQRMTPEARARLMRIVRGIMDDPDLFPRRGNGGRNGGRNGG